MEKYELKRESYDPPKKAKRLTCWEEMALQARQAYCGGQNVFVYVMEASVEWGAAIQVIEAEGWHLEQWSVVTSSINLSKAYPVFRRIPGTPLAAAHRRLSTPATRRTNHDNEIPVRPGRRRTEIPTDLWQPRWPPGQPHLRYGQQWMTRTVPPTESGFTPKKSLQPEQDMHDSGSLQAGVDSSVTATQRPAIRTRSHPVGRFTRQRDVDGRSRTVRLDLRNRRYRSAAAASAAAKRSRKMTAGHGPPWTIR